MLPGPPRILLPPASATALPPVPRSTPSGRAAPGRTDLPAPGSPETLETAGILRRTRQFPANSAAQLAPRDVAQVAARHAHGLARSPVQHHLGHRRGESQHL